MTLRKPVSSGAVMSLLIVSLTLGLSLALLASAPKDIEAAEPPSNVRVIVTFNAQPADAELALIHSFGGHERFVYGLIPAIAAEVPEQALAGLARNPLVSSVEVDATIRIQDVELDSSWGVKHVGAGDVHPTNTGAGVTVAVIDTGIDYTHTDLDANYLGGYDFYNNDADPMDDHSHGTHVSGIIAAEDNGNGVVGMAPDAGLYGYKVLGADGSGDYSGLIAALECATGSVPAGAAPTAQCVRADVVNMSLGGTADSPALEAAVAAADAAGVTVVAAAGNTVTVWELLFGCPVTYPGAYDDHVITVTFTDPSDSLTGYSCTGPEVDFAAPGDAVLSTVLDGGYAAYSGTSMATPHAAGLAALLVAAGTTDAASIEAQMCATTTPGLGPQPGNPEWYGCGVINAANALGIGANAAPVAIDDDSYVVVEDGSLNVPAPGLLANDSDPEGDTLTAILQSGASNGSVTLNEDGSFIYTPAADFSGIDTFTYRANDGASSSNVATVTISVTSSPDAPVAVSDDYEVAEGVSLNVPAPGVLVNDTDPDGDALTAVLLTTTSEGTLSLSSDGAFSYHPAGGFTGTDEFTYVASDGTSQSVPTTVTIRVTSGPAASVHVGDIDASSARLSQGRWSAVAAVTLHDANEGPASIATVIGAWFQGGQLVTLGSCVTNGTGICSIDSGAFPSKNGKATFTVIDVVAAAGPLDSALNHDPDGDSDGSIIEASK